MFEGKDPGFLRRREPRRCAECSAGWRRGRGRSRRPRTAATTSIVAGEFYFAAASTPSHEHQPDHALEPSLSTTPSPNPSRVIRRDFWTEIPSSRLFDVRALPDVRCEHSSSRNLVETVPAAVLGGIFGAVVAAWYRHPPVINLTLPFPLRRHAATSRTDSARVPEVERNADGTRRHVILRSVPERTAWRTFSSRQNVVNNRRDPSAHRKFPKTPHQPHRSLVMGWGGDIGFEVSDTRDYIGVQSKRLCRRRWDACLSSGLIAPPNKPNFPLRTRHRLSLILSVTEV